jgi:hypothetical protein
VTRLLLFAATGAFELGVCAWLIRRALTRQRAADLLYGRSRGLHWRRTRRRVPGKPLDGRQLSEQEEAVLAALTSGRRGRLRQ